jgi:hypothetical protein
VAKASASKGGNEMIKKLCAAGAMAAIWLVSTTAYAWDTIVTVPGNACGGFGLTAEGYVPFVVAKEITTKGVLKITYDSGTVTDGGGINTGPDGIPYSLGGGEQSPLQEIIGVTNGSISNVDALIGAFVPAYIVNTLGFAALDSTKKPSYVPPKAGIAPRKLFFVGSQTTYVDVRERGTLFLGINDWYCSDNGGGFRVRISDPLQDGSE